MHRTWFKELASDAECTGECTVGQGWCMVKDNKVGHMTSNYKGRQCKAI